CYSISLYFKGRGFRNKCAGKEIESPFFDDGGAVPQKSVDGWIILVTGIHAEAHDLFGDFGEIKDIHFHHTEGRGGDVQAYALFEYTGKQDAQAAINHMNGTKLFTQTVAVDWAISCEPLRRHCVR
ncbi:hypothetical protein GOP47_0029641, partial [Adiantum capillus-veneris]